MTRLAFPFGPNALGGSGAVSYASPGHVRDCLELLVMTMPGERVMRPDFGSPVRQMLFRGAEGAAATALEAALHASILQWLGHLLTIETLSVDFDATEAALVIAVTYRVTLTGETRAVELTKALS